MCEKFQYTVVVGISSLTSFYVRSVLDNSGMDQAKAVVTPGSKETSTAAATGDKQLGTTDR